MLGGFLNMLGCAPMSDRSQSPTETDTDAQRTDKPERHVGLTGLKALSIRQPWVWAIFHAGKDIENRDWSSRSPSLRGARSLIGRPFLIHASAGMNRSEYEDFIHTAHTISRTHPFRPGTILPPMHDLLRGGIVGRATLAGVVMEHSSPWFFGHVGIVLRDVELLPFVSCRGALGFFRPEIANV